MSYATEAAPKIGLADLRAGTNMVPSQAFDIDRYTAMEERDNALVADEILFGAMSSKFVYSIPAAGGKIEGISVIGARHLANKVGGIKHEIIGSITKKGSTLIFTSYPHDGHPFNVTFSSMPEVYDEPDFYKVVIKVTDMKKGNSIQVEKTEMRFELKSGSKTEYYERKHIEAIAQAKAFRNGMLSLLPQDIVQTFKIECLKLGQSHDITENVLDTKRKNVIGYAVRNGIQIDRAKLAALTMNEMAGLSKAAHEDGLEQFTRALTVLGISGHTMTDVMPGPGAAAAGEEAAAAVKTRRELRKTKPAETAQTASQVSQNDPPEADRSDPGPDTEREGQGNRPSTDKTPVKEEAPAGAAPSAAKAASAGLFGDDDFGNME